MGVYATKRRWTLNTYISLYIENMFAMFGFSGIQGAH